MKKKLFLFVSIIVLLISCKSEEQKQYDELIESSKNIYERIKDKPDYLFSSNNYKDDRYTSILDEKVRIIYKSKELEDNSKIDDRPTPGQKQELIDYLSKIQSILMTNTNVNSSNSESKIDLSKLSIKYDILEKTFHQVEKFGESEWTQLGDDKSVYLDSFRNIIYVKQTSSFNNKVSNRVFEFKNSSLYKETSDDVDNNIYEDNSFYNESGQLIKKELYENNKLTRVTKYTYSSNNKREKIKYDEYGYPIERNIETLDNRGNIILSKDYDKDNDFVGSFSQKFDKYNNQIEHKGFDQFGNMKLLISNQFKYDDNKIWVENISKSPGKYGFYYKTTREIKVR